MQGDKSPISWSPDTLASSDEFAWGVETLLKNTVEQFSSILGFLSYFPLPVCALLAAGIIFTGLRDMKLFDYKLFMGQSYLQWMLFSFTLIV